MKMIALLALWMPLAFDETSGGSGHTSGGSGSDNPNRLEPGECTDVCCDRPPIDGVGMPLGAQWLGNGGNPSAWEDDPFLDDAMGSATSSPGGESACVDVCANGKGELEGPNGADQTGAGEGDTIEVMICWSFKYPATMTQQSTVNFTGLTLGGGTAGGPSVGGGSSHSIQVTVWLPGAVCCNPTSVSS